MSDNDRGRTLGCAEVVDLAPELGLGVLTGVERADALRHIERCPSCRPVVESMAEAADSLLALAPEIEPPSGFESRVLARLRPLPLKRARRRRWVAPVLAAAAVAAALIAAVALGGGHPGFVVRHPAAIPALGGRDLTATGLRHNGRQVGQAFVYAGHPSWVFMTVEGDGPPHQVTCQVETANGRTHVLGSFTVADGYRSWGATIDLNPDKFREIQLVDKDAHVVASAAL